MSDKEGKNKKRKNCSPLSSNTNKKLFSDSEMENQMKQIVEQNERILAENKLILESNQEVLKELKNHYESCDRNFGIMKSEIVNLDVRVNFLERNSSSNAVNIFGIAVNESETSGDLLKIYRKIGTFLKTTPVSDKDINDIYRFGNDKKAVRIEFVSKLKKREFLKATKNKEIKGTDIGLATSEQIFFHEHLCHISHKLYLAAKQLKKEKKIKYVWSSNGTVLVRVAEGKRAIPIRSTADFMKLD